MRKIFNRSAWVLGVTMIAGMASAQITQQYLTHEEFYARKSLFDLIADGRLPDEKCTVVEKFKRAGTHFFFAGGSFAAPWFNHYLSTMEKLTNSLSRFGTFPANAVAGVHGTIEGMDRYCSNAMHYMLPPLPRMPKPTLPQAPRQSI